MVNKISSNTAKILIETKCVDFSLKKKKFLTYIWKKKVLFTVIAEG